MMSVRTGLLRSRRRSCVSNYKLIKADWLANQPPGGVITDLPQALAPVNNAAALASGAQLNWTSTPGATHYVVQVSRLSNFIIKDFDAIVTDTFVITGNLIPNFKYYWRVRGL